MFSIHKHREARKFKYLQQDLSQVPKKLQNKMPNTEVQEIENLENKLVQEMKDFKPTKSLRDGILINQIRKKPALRKKYGQVFLKDINPIITMIEKVKNSVNSDQTTILEIGGGSGQLTEMILNNLNCKKLVCYEIDEQWVEYMKNQFIGQDKLEIKCQDVLQAGAFEQLSYPVIILANLPYQISAKVLEIFVKNREKIQEGVIMLQEEVAQRLVAQKGKEFNATSIFFQNFLKMKLLDLVLPKSFRPQPKVLSRLLYFQPKPSNEIQQMPQEVGFWKFIRNCFRYPRKMLKSNIKAGGYSTKLIPEKYKEILNQRPSDLESLQYQTLWIDFYQHKEIKKRIKQEIQK